MSDFFVMLVLKTVIYYSKLLGFQNFACLKLEHYESDTDFIDRHYLFVDCPERTSLYLVLSCSTAIASFITGSLISKAFILPF